MPKQSSDYLKVFHLVGYLKSDECRIKVDDNGIINWIPNNCTPSTRDSYHNYIQNPDNWTYDQNKPEQRDAGVRNSTYLSNFVYEKKKASPTARMNRSASDPNANDTEITIKIENAKSTGKTDRRYKERNVQVAHPRGNGRVVGASVVLIINAINFALEYGPIYFRMYDESKIKDHYQVLMNFVLPDIITVINEEGIELDFKSLHRLCNIVLCGYCDGVASDSELYRLGKKIYKEKSNCKKNEYKNNIMLYYIFSICILFRRFKI
ncbi:MAG: hypothetical protein ACK5KL_05275 [Dysgonomonas sp.]